MLIVVTELTAIAFAQFSAAIGIIALVSLAILQALAAMWAGGGVGKVLLLATSLSIAGAAASGASAYFRKDIRHIETSPLVQRDGPLGWRLIPGGPRITRIVNGQTVYAHTFTIGADRHRRTVSADSGPTIAFFGDSFTFGDGVADGQTMPQAFADLTHHKFRVLNLGVDGYSPAQVLRALELGLDNESLKPTTALFMLTLDWHAARIACAHESLVGAPRYVSNHDGTVHFAGSCLSPPPPSGLGRLLMATPPGKAFLNGLRRVSDAEVKTYLDVIVAADRLARSKYNVPLRVLYLRNAGYLIFNHFSDDKIIEQLRQRGVLVYDLTLPQEGQGAFAIPQDGHPSAIAHRLHAQELIAALGRTEPKLLDSASETADRTSRPP